VLSLAASDKLLAGRDRARQFLASDQPSNKTSFYNMIGRVGQTKRHTRL